jgi:hypothetical protein
MTRMALALMASTALLASACGSPNPLVGRWTVTQRFPPAATAQPGDTGTITILAEFGADNSYTARMTGGTGCTGMVALSGFKIAVMPATATSGTFTIATLGTCAGGPVQCPFGGRMIPVLSCEAATAGMPGQYVLSADGRTASLSGTTYTRVD